MKKPGRQKPDRRLEVVEWVTGALLTIAVLLLHWRWLGLAGALWRDEAATVQFATMPQLGEIWTNLAYDNFPPLLLALLRGWIAIAGQSDAALRWFGFAIGLFSLSAFWIAARLFKVRAPLLLLAVTGLSPLAIYTIDSLRPYGLGIALMCLITACFWRAVASQRTGAAAWAAVAAILGVQCLFQNVAFVFAVTCAAMAVAIRVRDYRSAVMVCLAAGLSAFSLLIHLPHLIAARDWALVAQSPVSLSYLLIVAVTALRDSGWLATAGMLTALILLPASIVVLWLRQKPLPNQLLFAAIGSLTGVGIYLLFVLQTKLPTQKWYYIIVIAFFALCLDAVSFSSHLTRWLRAAFALLVAITSVPSLWSNPPNRQTNIDHVAAMVRASASADDLVIVHPWYCGIGWNYYFKSTTGWTTIPPLSDLRIHRYDLLKEQMVRQDQASVVAPVMDRIRNTLQTGHRVWLVGGLPTPPPGRPAPVLPAAPHSEAGWSGEGYQSAWGMQIARFIQEHAGKYDKIPINTTQPISAFENLPLGVVTGWRE